MRAPAGPRRCGGALLLVAAALYALALLALIVMRPLPRPEPSPAVPCSATSGEGFGFMFRTGWLFATLSFATLYVLVLIGPIEVLLPFAVRDRTGGGAAAFAFVLTAFGGGGAVGSVAVSSLPMPRRYLTVMLLLVGRRRGADGADRPHRPAPADGRRDVRRGLRPAGRLGHPGAPCCSGACLRTGSAGWPAWTSSSHSP